MNAIDQITALSGAGTREWVIRLFWDWYESHLDDKITLKILSIPIKVKIRQLRPVFEKLFGPRPVVV